MDVVRTNIERIGGAIELKSIAGKGSTFTIKIPLTLAIVSALIVESAGHRFAVPQISVLELVRVAAASGTTIERVNNTRRSCACAIGCCPWSSLIACLGPGSDGIAERRNSVPAASLNRSMLARGALSGWGTTGLVTLSSSPHPSTMTARPVIVAQCRTLADKLLFMVSDSRLTLRPGLLHGFGRAAALGDAGE
jgi:hypothetical protein